MFHDPRRVLDRETSRPRNVGATLRRFTSYFKPYWPRYLLVLALMLVGTWAQVRTPVLIGQAVDCFLTPATVSQFGRTQTDSFPGGEAGAEGLSGSDGLLGQAARNCWYTAVQPDWTTDDFIAGLGKLILLVVGLYVLTSVATGLMFYLMTWSGQHVLKTLRVRLFQHIMRLSIGYHVEHEAGNIMSRITNDADTIQQALSFALVQVASGALLIVWVAYSMLTRSVPYALVALAVLPLMVLATSWFSGQARKAFRRTRLEMGSVNADLQESISGVREVQAFGREQENIDAFRKTNAANRDANIRAVAFTSALAPALDALGFVALMLVAAVGGLYLLRGQDFFGTAMSFGLIVTFLGYVQRFNQPVRQISILWTNIQSGIAGAERIFGLMDVVPEVQDRPDARELPEIQGNVVLEDVWAEYKPGEPVLKGVSLRAMPGQTVAVVGPTGAGKTTLANLIPRFYDVNGGGRRGSGAVRIDGVDVRDVTAASLRSQIGVVLQDSFLFSTTVMENIRFGRPDASDEEVIAAAKLAHADSFIQRLPEGYQTVLGERGTGLSLGQRQLLSIARAALADPRILILDEATSSVDTRTERQIQAALEKLLHGRTSFVIAHRLSTIRNADQVLVLNHGEIIERGTHSELMAARGFYYDLYMSQFRREAPDAVLGGNGRGPGQDTGYRMQDT